MGRCFFYGGIMGSQPMMSEQEVLNNSYDSTTSAGKVTQATALSSNIDSITTYPGGCEVTVVDLATDADVVVTASPAKLLGIYVSVVMSAHVALLKDSTTTKITLPASTAAGTTIPCYGATFATNITVESDNSGTGTLLVFWQAL